VIELKRLLLLINLAICLSLTSLFDLGPNHSSRQQFALHSASWSVCLMGSSSCLLGFFDPLSSRCADCSFPRFCPCEPSLVCLNSKADSCNCSHLTSKRSSGPRYAAHRQGRQWQISVYAPSSLTARHPRPRSAPKNHAEVPEDDCPAHGAVSWEPQLIQALLTQACVAARKQNHTDPPCPAHFAEHKHFIRVHLRCSGCPNDDDLIRGIVHSEFS
jgi:hypothetical protein